MLEKVSKRERITNASSECVVGFSCIEKQKAKAEKASRAREDVAQSLQKTDQLIDLIDAKLNSAIRQPAELTPGNSQYDVFHNRSSGRARCVFRGGFGDGPTAVVMAGRRQTK